MRALHAGFVFPMVNMEWMNTNVYMMHTVFHPAALLEQLNNLRRTSPASSGFASPPPPEITPLTRQQLQQAMIHIIRVSIAVLCYVQLTGLTPHPHPRNPTPPHPPILPSSLVSTPSGLDPPHQGQYCSTVQCLTNRVNPPPPNHPSSLVSTPSGRDPPHQGWYCHVVCVALLPRTTVPHPSPRVQGVYRCYYLNQY